MNSPMEVPVGDGDEEGYLWPSEEIRKRAIDGLMKKLEQQAAEIFSAAADRAVKSIEDRTKKMTEELHTLSVKAGEILVPDLNHVTYDKLPGLVRQNIEATKEIAKVFWNICDTMQKVDNEIGQIHNLGYEQKRDLIYRTLMARGLFDNLFKMKEKMIKATNAMGIYSDY